MRAQYQLKEAHLIAQIEALQKQQHKQQLELQQQALHEQNDTGQSPSSDAFSRMQAIVQDLADRQVAFEQKARVMWDEMKSSLEELQERVEGWDEEVSIAGEEPNTPVIRLTARHPPQTKPLQKPTTPNRRRTNLMIRWKWKDVMAVRLPPLPESAGALRAWKRILFGLCLWLLTDLPKTYFSPGLRRRSTAPPPKRLSF